MAYHIVDVNSRMEDLEQVGTKEKYWFSYNNKEWLIKLSREKSGEHWAEKVAEQICIKLNIPHARYELARWRGEYAVISESMISNGEYRLVLGNEVLLSKDKSYPAVDGKSKYVKRREHTVYRVAGVLGSMNLNSPPGFVADFEMNAVGVFLGYLMLDALIGNQDRHDENWAIFQSLSPEAADCLAPTFDHASGFACTERDETREKRLRTKDKNYSVEAFSKKAKSGLYRNENDTSTMLALDVFKVVASQQKEAAGYWLARLEHITDEFIEEVLGNVPNDIMSDITREFTRRMLIANREALLCTKQEK